MNRGLNRFSGNPPLAHDSMALGGQSLRLSGRELKLSFWCKQDLGSWGCADCEGMESQKEKAGGNWGLIGKHVAHMTYSLNSSKGDIQGMTFRGLSRGVL